MNLRVVLTGATGMVGEGVLHECLHHPDVEQVLVIGRRPCGVSHPRLREILHDDFFDLSSIEDILHGYNACFFCLGVSSIGMKEPEYRRLTYDLTMHVARTLIRANPDLTFCYVSGAGTDGTERSNTMWARVKGKTENDLLELGTGRHYMFRPGYMQPTDGLKNTLAWYKFISWMYPALRFLFPKYVSTLKELGLAMINVGRAGYKKPVLEVKDIVQVAQA